MPELSATALFGFVLTVLFFSLGTATVYQANNPVAGVQKTSLTTNGLTTTTTTTAAPPKDYPNIVFGSLFLAFSVVLAWLTARAVINV